MDEQRPKSGQTRENGCTVLMYHAIVESLSEIQAGQSRKFCVSRQSFAEQLGKLRDSSRVAVRLDSLISGKPLPHSSVIFTFDDGRESDYSIAFPALLQAGMTATFFVNTAYVGKPGYLNWDQVQEMYRSGMTFGSHSHEHKPLTILSQRELRAQLTRSKGTLENVISDPVKMLSVPYGFVNSAVYHAARELGYQLVCTSHPGIARVGRYSVPRVAILHNTSLLEFDRIVSGDSLSFAVRKLWTVAAYIPRHILLHLRPSQPGINVVRGQA